MVSMTVTVSSSLTDPDYPRIKRFVWLALPEGTTYRTGDHLTVLPTNDDDLVAGAPQVDLDTALSIMPSRPQRHGIAVDRPLTVRELLTHHIELQGRPTAAQLVTLAELNPCPPEKTALRSLADDEEARTGDQRTLLDSSRSSRHLREVLTWPRSWTCCLRCGPVTTPSRRRRKIARTTLTSWSPSYEHRPGRAAAIFAAPPPATSTRSSRETPS
jgi:cytochrome P450/NADPH-cytochrome P450 reductase